MTHHNTPPSHMSGDDKTSIARQALAHIKTLQERVRQLEGARHAPLAVIGIGCRFPGGIDTPAMFWQQLMEGSDLIAPPSEKRKALNPEGWSPTADRPGGYLTNVAGFDAAFFGFSPREAERTDPQQRLFLTTAWKALEDAAINPERLRGSDMGVFAGVSLRDYDKLASRHHDLYGIDGQDPAGMGGCFVSGRLSHVLGTHGPSITMDTACSSSLAAIHMAALSLRSGQCSVALAGGVNLILYPEMTDTFARAGMLSPRGRCHPFAEGADGFTRGEGCGVVVLKLLDDAMRDGDPIRAVLRGTAVNQDGPSSGPTTPYGPAQVLLHRAVLDDARLPADAIAYMEAHGTGTALGDPIEFGALAEVHAGRGSTLWLGSVKSNMGHLETAAGVAGFIKAALVVQHGIAPPSLHFTEPSRHIPWDTVPIRVADHPVALVQNGGKVVAGVSSFGLSGTNAGALLETPPRRPEETTTSTFMLSAPDPSSFKLDAERWKAAAGEIAPVDLAAFTRTSRRGRPLAPVRAAATVESLDQLRETLERWSADGPPTSPEGAVAFLFSGQGTQYPGMGAELYRSERIFRDVFDACAQAMDEFLPMALTDIAFPATDTMEETVRLAQARLAQPALFAVETALAELVKSVGIIPDLVIGHSIGEYAAAVQAGLLNLSDGARLAAARGKFLSEIPARGTMHAVFNLSFPTVERLLSECGSPVTVAAHNGPTHLVLAGMESDLEAVSPALLRAGGKVVAMQMLQAYHTSLVADAAGPLEAEVRRATLSTPRLPIYSTMLGRRADADMQDPTYWGRQLSNPVRYAEAVVAAMDGHPFRLAIEMGPHAVLTPLTISLTHRDDHPSPVVVPTLVRGEDARNTVQTALAHACAVGCDVRSDALDDTAPRMGGLPGRRFDEREYWLRAETAEPACDATTEAGRYVVESVAAILHMSADELGEVENLYDAGLNSIHAMEVLEVWERQTGTTVDLGAMLRLPTLAEWTRLFREGQGLAMPPHTKSQTGTPANATGSVPMTPVQQAYWAGRRDDMPLGGVACQVYQEFDGGNVNPKAFRRAIERLIERHEMLRAVVGPDGNLRILDTPPVETAFAIFDLAGQDPAEIQGVRTAIRKELAAKVRDPSRWPLFDIRLSLAGPDESRVHLGLDMLIADAASLSILIKELDVLCGTPEAPLPPLAASAAEAMTLVASRTARERSRRHWLDRLPSLPGAPALPLAEDPERLSGHAFQRRHLHLDTETWSRLRAACHSHALTPTALFATLFALVLRRWSGSERFLLTMTQSGRPLDRKDMAGLIGDFTSLSLLECAPAPSTSLLDNIRACQTRLHDDLQYRDFSAIDLLRAAAEIDPTAVPHAPVVFTSAIGVDGEGLALDTLGRWGWGVSQTPQVWLDHQIFELQGGLRLQWDFAERLFPAGLIDAMVEAYGTLLAQVSAAAPDWSGILAPPLPPAQADEPLPGWLAPACLLGRGADYCVPVSATLFVAFRRDGGHIHDLRLISSAFEAPGGVLSAPPHLTRRPSHPGAIFRTLFLPSLRRSMADLARTLCVPQSSLYKFLAGNRRSVGAFSLGLSEVTGTSPDFWERLQGAHDVFVHARSPTPHIPLSALSDAIETGPSARRTRRLMGYAPVATILVTLLVAALPGPADAHEQQSVVDGRRVQPTPEMIRKLQGEHARERNPATAPPPSTHAKPKKEKGRNGEKRDEGLTQQNQ